MRIPDRTGRLSNRKECGYQNWLAFGKADAENMGTLIRLASRLVRPPRKKRCNYYVKEFLKIMAGRQAP